jgi:hypothetical protein
MKKQIITSLFTFYSGSLVFILTFSTQAKQKKIEQRMLLYLFGPSGETCGLCPQFASQIPDFVRLRRGSSNLARNSN